MKDYVVTEEQLTMEEKLRILSDAAKYDVSCSSSGVERRGNGRDMGSTSAAGICHSFSADGRCISLLKILYTNECIFDCKYCQNRVSNDVPRATFTPEEICRLTVEFYRRNYIEGLFLSSGIVKSPDYTMEQIYETIYKLRLEYHFRGYIHVKGIPGCDAELLEQLGYLVDRMSVNLELPTAQGLRTLAPHKNRKNILTPMKEIQVGIYNNRKIHGKKDKRGALTMTEDGYEEQRLESRLRLREKIGLETIGKEMDADVASIAEDGVITGTKKNIVGTNGKYFVPAGQSTQMIIGATPESDYHIMQVTQALYQNYDMKRVFYSAYVPLNEDRALPELGTKPPLLREHRLYQADWLLRFYGFDAGELLTTDRPYFNELLDPKCDWAVRHLEFFPVEINSADYDMLLRVPGIGVKSARRILQARKHGSLDFTHLRKMGVVLKRAVYFINCNGRMMYHIRMDEKFLTSQLTERETAGVQGNNTYRQMSIFDFLKEGR